MALCSICIPQPGRNAQLPVFSHYRGMNSPRSSRYFNKIDYLGCLLFFFFLTNGYMIIIFGNLLVTKCLANTVYTVLLSFRKLAR